MNDSVNKMLNITSKRVSRVTMSLALAFSVNVTMVMPAHAQSINASEAKTRINIAGRERMLIQRVVKSACFSSLGIERAAYRAELVETEDLFEQSLLALQNGDPALGLRPENAPGILAELEVVSMEWGKVASLADVAVSPRGISIEGLYSLDALGLDLLAKANAAVQTISQTYVEQLDELPLIVSVSLDIAGRQRMLSQKMAKEFCLIDAGVTPADNRANLAETISVFNATLAGLQNGLPGMVIPAPNYDIRQKLLEVEHLWAPVDAVLQAVADGGQITDADRKAVVENMEAVLAAMNEAVGMYEYINAVP